MIITPISTKNNILAVGDRNGYIHLIDINNGNFIKKLYTKNKKNIEEIIFSTDSKNVSVSDEDNIYIFDIDSGNIVTKLSSEEGFSMVPIGYNQEVFISRSKDGSRSTYKVWDSSFFKIYSFSIDYDRELSINFFFDENDTSFNILRSDGSQEIWNLQNHEVSISKNNLKSDLLQNKLEDTVLIDYINDYIITHKDNIILEITSLKNNKLIFNQKLPSKFIGQVKASLRNNLIIYNDKKGVILFNFKKNKTTLIKKGLHKFSIGSQSGLLVTSESNRIEIRDIITNKILTTLQTSGLIRDIIFSKTNKYLAIINSNGKVDIINSNILVGNSNHKILAEKSANYKKVLSIQRSSLN